MLTSSKGHGFLSRVGMKMGTDFSHYLKNILTLLPSLSLDSVMVRKSMNNFQKPGLKPTEYFGRSKV